MPGDVFNGLQLRLTQCAGLNKPLIVGEAGIIPNEVGGTFAARAAAFRAKLLRQIPAGVAGYLPVGLEPGRLDARHLRHRSRRPGARHARARSATTRARPAPLTFAPGETTKTVTVKVIGDTARRAERDLPS